LIKLNKLNMKKLAILLLIIVSVSACKRKQDLRELDSNETLAKYPVQCYNGNQDTDETGIDCGGPCAPCNVPTPTCTPVANTVSIGASNFAAVGSSCGLSGSNFTLSGSYSSGSYTIQLGNTSPDLSVAYSITNSVPGVTEATVSFSDFSLGTLSLISAGNVYITQVGGVYHATICGGTAHSWITGLDYSIQGNVACP